MVCMNGIIVGSRQQSWSRRPQAKAKLVNVRNSSRAAFHATVSCPSSINTPQLPPIKQRRHDNYKPPLPSPTPPPSHLRSRMCSWPSWYPNCAAQRSLATARALAASLRLFAARLLSAGFGEPKRMPFGRPASALAAETPLPLPLPPLGTGDVPEGAAAAAAAWGDTCRRPCPTRALRSSAVAAAEVVSAGRISSCKRVVEEEKGRAGARAAVGF